METIGGTSSLKNPVETKPEQPLGLLKSLPRGERIKAWLTRTREAMGNDVKDNNDPRTLETAGIGILSGASSENTTSTKK